uniref:Uncharacterized protein n=1 Tax=Magallana gigas TaxID=29159 RepID=A0A8W8LLQ0_MAGGI
MKTRIAACDLERNLRQQVTTTQRKIEEAAARYMEDNITASHFLKVCGSIYAGVGHCKEFPATTLVEGPVNKSDSLRQALRSKNNN